jgi:membrane dipeptidase
MEMQNKNAPGRVRLSRRDFLKGAALAGASALLPGHILRAQFEPLPLIIDAHLDLGWNIVNFGRDYTRSAYAIREDGTYYEQGRTMIGLPELLQGRVALLVGTIFVIPAYDASSAAQIARYSTPAEAHRWGWTMLEAIEALAARSDNFLMVRSQADLGAVLASWALDQPVEQRRVGIMLAIEGADPITQPGELQDWYARGLRSIGLSWGRTQYAGSTSEPGDLTELGVSLLSEMKRLGIVLDTAHLSETAFWQAVDWWEDGPLSYSHGNSRYFLPSERGLTDAQINAIVARDGIVGIGLYNGFYQQNLTRPGQVTVDDVANAIDYICQLAGNCNHAAIGSDSDGGFGAESAPYGIDTVADLQKIPAALAQRGYQPDDIDRITHDNWLRLFRRVLT